ncbi:nitroreductase [Limosilactobacillus kribbianus]|jgi:nitroreductase|uniref:nitroreductase n=1 Tax=Limosilactobacillus kribbianus TaxID=2982695 RepID=UPI00226431A3|nr:nitroreductase [Limosilactobacillus kribbianus]
MEFDRVVTGRHSVREFSERSISHSKLRQIVKLAQWAPSWVNSQPWKVYIATGKHLEDIKAMFQQKDAAHTKSNPDLAVMSRTQWNERTQANMKKWRHDIVAHFSTFDEAHSKMTRAMNTLNSAAAIAYITIPTQTPDWSILDSGAFAQTLMLAAKDLGIDSIPTYNSVRFPDEIRSILGIPTTERLMVGIELGYATNSHINHYRSDRVPVDEILKIED